VKFNIIERNHHIIKQLMIGFSLGVLAGPAHAQVMDIRPDGSIATYTGPVIASREGTLPLQAARPAPQPVRNAIADSAGRHRVSPKLVEAVAWQESRMNQSAVSPKGARGVMQLMPGTARNLRVQAGDLEQNIEGGTTYLARMLERFDGDIIKTLAAYNAGPEAVTRHGGVPPYPETQKYVASVLDHLATDAASEVRP
jgi:soluble lytic murein transglycosylase-like protein